MSTPVEFLTSFGKALSSLSLYPDGHRSREGAVDAVYQKLRDLVDEAPNPSFSFLEDEVLYGNAAVRELRGWEWGGRLTAIGVERLQFDRSTTREELEGFLDELLARLTLRAIDTSEARQLGHRTSIRFGTLGIRGAQEQATPIEGNITTATISFGLQEEAETIRFMHQEVHTGSGLPLAEAEAVVRGLSVAMHGDQQVMLPLLRLREFDEYTTTHSLNVCVLAMALAEWLGLGDQDIRAFGTAGLLHDLGKVKIPLEILTKPGKLTDEERIIMNEHPANGARIIISSEPDLDLAAVVAYEHHIMLNGGGYPTLTYSRDCHHASKLVHVCDVYDALRTHRPYRDAWPTEKVLAYLEERSGSEFDGEIAHAFVAMIQEHEPQMTVLSSDEEPLPAL